MAKLVIGTDKTVATPALFKVVEVPVPERYALLSRVTDDNNNDIGIVVGYHIDANSQKYAVVCLNAEYRSMSLQYLSGGYYVITGLPTYQRANCYDARETATFNCDKVLAYCTTTGETSAAVTHCRSKTFTIDGVQYAGQIPNIMELLEIYQYRRIINSNDPTATEYSGVVIPEDSNVWSSTQRSNRAMWVIYNSGSTTDNTKDSTGFVPPILEIPID